MNYEQKYKKVLSFLKDLKPHMSDYCKEKLDGFFPELKESENEKISKEIIQFLQLPHPQFIGKRNYEEWIAWLEKQGEQKPSEKLLKDLPKWKKANEHKDLEKHIAILEDGKVLLSNYLEEGDYYIELDDLKTLPKEEE